VLSKSEAEKILEPYHISRKRGLVTINVRDQLLARFKKLDRDKRSHNIPTQQSLLFKAQLDLPGIESSLTHLDVGYVLNELQTGLDGVYITCPYGKGIAWWIDLNDSALGAAGNVVPIAPAPIAPAAPGEVAARRQRIKPKQDLDGKKEDEGKP
jgi:hypothetical protein